MIGAPHMCVFTQSTGLGIEQGHVCWCSAASQLASEKVDSMAAVASVSCGVADAVISSQPRRCGRRPAAPSRIHRAHQAHIITVWVRDNGVTCSPECVVGRLSRSITSRHEFRIELIDRFTVRQCQSNERRATVLGSSPGSVIDLCQSTIVELESQTRRQGYLGMANSIVRRSVPTVSPSVRGSGPRRAGWGVILSSRLIAMH
jgi:hypothetical protein